MPIKKRIIRKRKGTKEEQDQRDRYTRLRSMLRRAWIRDPERLAALKLASRPYKGDNKRQKKEIQCAICREWMMQKFVTVDHIVPCGTFLKMEDWATFGPNLFCNRDNLQVLCVPCHKIKSKEERAK